MKKIIALIKPFEAKQKLYVYEDTQLKETIEIGMYCIEDQIAKCCDKYDVDIIDLVGIKEYCQKIKENLLTPTRFKLKDNIKINVI